MIQADTVSSKQSPQIHGSDIRAFLCEIAQKNDGVECVRFLHKTKTGAPRHKAYFILATHDMRRDYTIVRTMCQVDGVDYDLVPVQSEGMIPDEAEAL